MLLLSTSFYGSMFSNIVHKVSILLGLLALLYLSGAIQKKVIIGKSLRFLSGFSFFVFAFHEPLLITTKKVVYKVTAPESELFITAIYFFCPIVTIVISLIACIVLKKMLPKFSQLITGGR